MPPKKRRGKRFRLAVLWILTPLALWAAAFTIWLGWPAISSRLRAHRSAAEAPSGGPPVTRKAGDAESSRGESRETIFEEDRRNLDEILRKK